MRGIAGRAAQGAAAVVVPSITPAVADKTGLITLIFFSCSFLLYVLNTNAHVDGPLSGTEAVRELLRLSGSSDWECAFIFQPYLVLMFPLILVQILPGQSRRSCVHNASA
jgi:hypothetical protein